MFWVLIFVFTLVIVIIARILFTTYQRRPWVASQDPEVVISGRIRAAEKARALLHEQIDYDFFRKELGQSQDPEIQKLVNYVDCMMLEDEVFQSQYRDSIEQQIRRLEGIAPKRRTSA